MGGGRGGVAGPGAYIYIWESAYDRSGSRVHHSSKSLSVFDGFGGCDKQIFF